MTGDPPIPDRVALVPEFLVWQDFDGWHGRHNTSREMVHAATFLELRDKAAAKRIAHTWHEAWGMA